MRAGLLLVGSVVAGLATAMTVIDLQAAGTNARPSCLRFRDFTSLTRVDDYTAIASTRGSARFKVVFRGSCRNLGRPDNTYVVRLQTTTECFDRDDVLEFRHGLCFIESVTPIPPA